MTFPIDVSRRSFLVNASRGTIALAVLGVTGCGPTALSSVASSEGSSVPGAGSSGASGSPPTGGSAGAPPSSAAGGVTWQRANLGFVSAYVLARAGEAAIVDTGLPGNEGTIGEALKAAGLDWGNVGHVILTHRHGDHVGSIDAILAAASDATGYAGEADLPSITSPRALTSVKDGDTVLGLRIVATPGHTIGHVSVFDEAGGILVAGDALGTDTGTLAGSKPSFTEDLEQAKASVVKLGKLTFETLLVGHGDPIIEGASARVAAFAAGN